MSLKSHCNSRNTSGMGRFAHLVGLSHWPVCLFYGSIDTYALQRTHHAKLESRVTLKPFENKLLFYEHSIERIKVCFNK